jgi:serine/threonine protein kinase/tetratricopeptide (TPR) repeat protein
MADLLARLEAALGDRYAIQRELGRGGMATVYLAEDLRHHRPVALKVLKPEIGAAVATDRFLREIALAAKLAHPHILPVYDSGRIAGSAGRRIDEGAEPSAIGHRPSADDSSADILYYVMPYVEGESLRGRLNRERRLPLGQALRIVHEVADALSHAHQHGVIHRDVKPENVLFEGGHAVLTDFGVARALLEAGGGERLTTAGMAVGTPTYMSPEQAAGEQMIDARADLYALAVLAYEMLAGAPPFAEGSARAIIAAHLTRPPDPLRRFRPEVPVDVEAAIARALAKHPADRFASIAEFRDALDAAATTTATAPAAGPEPAPWRTESVAVLPFVNMSNDPENEFFADGITDDIITALARVEGLHVASRTSAFAYKKHHRDIRDIGRELNVATVLEGSVRKAGNRLRITAQLVTVADGYHVWSERYDRDLEDVFAIQDEIARAIVTALEVWLGDRAGTPLVKAQTDNPEAYSQLVKGRYFLNQRGVGLAKALECFAAATKEDPGYAAAYAGLADAHTLLAWYGFVAPREALPQARTAALRSLEIDPGLGVGYCSLGYVKLHWDWDWVGAGRDFTQAIAISRHSGPIHQWYSEYLTAVGRVEEALEAAQRAQQLEPLGLIITTRLGDAWYCVRQYERAIQECRRATEMDPGFVPAHVWIGLAHLQRGTPDEAVRVFENARALPGAGPSLMLACCGLAYARAGRPRDAEDVLHQLGELSRQRYVSSFDVALVLLGLGRHQHALTSLEQAAEERACWLPRLLSDPVFDELRGEPRFRRLLGAMGLPPGPAAAGDTRPG